MISFSGGETSAFMAWWLLNCWTDRHLYEIIVVFANTGEENEETLIFADRCDKYFGFNMVWVEAITNTQHGKGVTAKVVDYKTASRNGEPFEAMIAKHGIPNISTKHCSRELKKYTIRSYVRLIKKWKKSEYQTAIGIRSDEIDRISNDRKKERLIYPLIEFVEMDKQAVNRFWRDQPFRLELKGYQGNCKVCWKKSLRKLMTIAKESPEKFDNFEKWEKQYENYIPESRNKGQVALPVRFFRGNLSVSDIKQMSKQPFEPAVDDAVQYVSYKQTEMFGHELDVSNGCIESCEVF